MNIGLFVNRGTLSIIKSRRDWYCIVYNVYIFTVIERCVGLRPLGLRRNKLSKEHFRSSTIEHTWSGSGWYAHLARLDSGSLVNAWRPDVDDTNQWWEVSMGL